MNSNSYDLFLFDFDGVLFDTNRLKTAAFRRALAGFPENSIDAFVRYHELNGGISRYTKLRYFFTDILNQAADDSEITRIADRFGVGVTQLMMNASPVPGSADFVKGIADISPLIICSGGNSAEINTLLDHHRMTSLFRDVLGNEQTKAEHARDRVQPFYDRVLFFGDSRYDMEVAEAFNFEFIFVTAVTDWPEGELLAREHGHRVISDFTDSQLEPLLRQ